MSEGFGVSGAHTNHTIPASIFFLFFDYSFFLLRKRNKNGKSGKINQANSLFVFFLWYSSWFSLPLRNILMEPQKDERTFTAFRLFCQPHGTPERVGKCYPRRTRVRAGLSSHTFKLTESIQFLAMVHGHNSSEDVGNKEKRFMWDFSTSWHLTIRIRLTPSQVSDHYHTSNQHN